MNIFGIAEKAFDELILLLSQNLDIEKAVLFGSRALGKYKEGSDLDIALYGTNIKLNDQLNLSLKLEKLDYPYSYDFQIYNNINDKDVLEHIDRVGIDIYQKLLYNNSELKKCNLCDVINFGNGKTRPKSEGDIPIYGGNGILGYTAEANYYGETIIIGRVGAYCGSVYYENRPIWISDNALAAKSKIFNSAKYLYYFLIDLKLNHLAEGSSHPLVTQTLLNSIEIEICNDENEQKTIAGILGSLDDKIELLNQRNKTLESMAETLFRQWFVEEADENWIEKPLDEIAFYLNGLACQKFPPKNEIDKLPVLKIKDLRNGFTDNSDWASTDIGNEYIIENGDVIFSWSGSLLLKIWDGEKCILNQHLFKVTSDKYPKWYYYFWTKFHLEKFISIAESKSTTMGHIKKEDLSCSMVLVPDETELNKMDSIVTPIIEKLIASNKQIISLIKLRDNLLPKLISGEVNLN